LLKHRHNISRSQCIAKSQQQKPAIQKLTKESFLKGSDEFKLEEVIAEFERKGIDEKYYKDLV
jgi:hypothetical protein